MTPKPVTLERINLIDPSMAYGRPTIQTDYCVTEKTDGERMLMYVNKAGRAYLINNTKDVKDIGIQFKAPELRNALFDGEYVPIENLRDPTASVPIFAIFDVYFVDGGKPVYHLPLKPDRDNYIKQYAALCKSDKIEFMAKEHREGDIFEASKAIWSKRAEFKYEVDGLIYTPAKMAVFGYYPVTKHDTRPKKIPRTSKWDRVLKWKPEDQNTIDFLVKTDGVLRKDVVGKEYIQLELYVGYSLKQKEPITVFEGLKLVYDDKYRSKMLGDNTDENTGERNAYIARKFEPVGTYKMKNAYLANIYKTDIDDEMIQNNTIVEFAFNLNKLKEYGSESAAWCWEPLRLRDDKTRKYMSEMATEADGPDAQVQAEMPKQTANDFRVAMGVWRSIHEPVSEDIIMSGLPHRDAVEAVKSSAPSPDSDDAVYYVETNIPRNELLSVTMTKYHNQIIKHMLYNYADTDALLDIACGKGGDINRYRSPHFGFNSQPFKFVLGVDLYHDNIENPVNGAYARLINLKIEDGPRPSRSNVIFVVGDAAHAIANGAAAMKAKPADDESRALVEFLYTNHDVPVKIRQAFSNNRRLIENLHGIAANKFSMVSCMFAIHYFFKQEHDLRNFLQNVSNNLKMGGLFVTTFMDGQSVKELLAKNKGRAEGRSSAQGVRLWSINANNREVYESEEIQFSKRIEVYIESINQLYPEYLVDFELLKRYALEYNLQLVDSQIFTELLNKNKDDEEIVYITSQSGLRNIYQNMQHADPALKQFSGLNRWAIFERRVA